MTTSNPNKPSLVLEQCLCPLFYFDVFSYPLTTEEIKRFSPEKINSIHRLEEELQHFHQNHYLSCSENLYSLEENFSNIKKRKENNQRAKNIFPKAIKQARFIHGFPFVRAVFISGALSKNVQTKDGDIDFFIITKPGRLWIARTFLILYKKIFLFNSHKYFCVNYFVTTDNLEIEEKNIFTATEIVTLLPMTNPKFYHKFMETNAWVHDFYPNARRRETEHIKPTNNNLIKRFFEFVFSGLIGNWLDDFFRKGTHSVWRKKFTGMKKSEFDLAFKSTKNVSKHHPESFQTKVIDKIKERILLYEKKHNIQLDQIRKWMKII